jgi:toxin CptA
MTLPQHAVYAPLRLQPGRSLRLAAFLLLVHVLSLAALVITPLPLWLRLGLGLLLMASLIHGHGLHIARGSPRAITRAVWDELGLWRLTLASGRTLEAQLLPDSFVTLPLVVLNFRAGPWCSRRSLILSGDAVDPELLRKLRVRLKLEYGKEQT